MTAAPKSAELLRERIRAAVTYQYMPMAVRTLLSEAETALAAQTPPAVEGWKLVPIEPTEAMAWAGVEAANTIAATWSAMLSASPTPPAAGMEDGRLTAVFAYESGDADGRARGIEDAAMVAEGWRSPLRPGTDARLLGHQEAAKSIAAAIRLLSEGSK